MNEIEVTAATITPTTPDTLELVGTTIVDELQVEGNEITPTTNDTYIVLTPTGTGKVTVDTLDIKNGEITPNTANTNITLSPSGTGRVVFDGATTQTVAGISLEIHAIGQPLTVSVNCSLASIFKVILDTNVQFVINNLPTGGTVTLIVQQDGGGSRTATFGTESSTAVRFPGGAPTLTAAAGSIDVITIFNDGVTAITRASHRLQGFVGDIPAGLIAGQFGHRRAVRAGQAVLAFHGCFVKQELRRLQLHGHLGKLPLNPLEFAQRAVELLADQHVFTGDVETVSTQRQ